MTVRQTMLAVLMGLNCCGSDAGRLSADVADDLASRPADANGRFSRPPFEVLTREQQERVERAVDRGLEYLAGRQQATGAFASRDVGQPGITSLCVMAFLSHGDAPDQGVQGARLTRAVDFVLDCQREDGLFSLAPTEASHVHAGASHAGNYNHAISGLMLGEVYGMCSDAQNERIRTAIVAGLKFMRQQQTRRKWQPVSKGGWRYLRELSSSDADVSVTSWQIMFMRSARNAGFDVPKAHVDEALEFVQRCFDPRQQTFIYAHKPQGAYALSRGVAGGGIVCLSLGGDHDSDMARSAGRWILNQSFDQYNRGAGPYHYGAYYCSQAMFQLGGEYWEQFYPHLVDCLTRFQRSDGSWDIEQDANAASFGNCYTTALCVLALTPPYQLLPIYQR